MLHWACAGLCFDTVNMLVGQGINVNITCYEKKRSALHDAMTAFCEASTEEELNDGRKIIALLVEKGCKYTLRDSVRHHCYVYCVCVVSNITLVYRITPLSLT